jgi:hypothetical protein
MQPADTAERLARSAAGAPPGAVDAAAQLLQAVSRRRERAPFVAEVLLALAGLTDVAGASAVPGRGGSSYSVLLDLLDQPQVLDDLRRRDPLAPARLRGLRLRERLLEAEGGACSSAELAQLLGVSRQAIDKRRKAGKLIGLDLGRRGYLYPVFQVGLAGLGELLAELDWLDPWSQLAFILTPNVWLDGETPLELLRRGALEPAVMAARSYGEQVGA